MSNTAVMFGLCLSVYKYSDMIMHTEFWVTQKMPSCTDPPQSVNVCQSAVCSDDVVNQLLFFFWALLAHTELCWQTRTLPSECCESAGLLLVWIILCICVTFLWNLIGATQKEKSERDVYKFNNILFFPPFWIFHN